MNFYVVFIVVVVVVVVATFQRYSRVHCCYSFTKEESRIDRGILL